MFVRQLQHAAHRAFRRLGYDVRRLPSTNGQGGSVLYGGWEPARAYAEPAYVGRLGFSPRTVFDVGVGAGTRFLYESFPRAYFVLVEPLKEFDASVRETLQTHKGESHLAAAGAEAGKRIIHVEPTWSERSSFFERFGAEATGDTVERREVPVVRLDDLLAEHRYDPPFGLKIDAEGAELDVLKGATAVLRQTQFVIAEIAVAHRFEGSYDFAQVIALLDAAGLGVCDILDIGRIGAGEVAFLDLVFRRVRDA